MAQRSLRRTIEDFVVVDGEERGVASCSPTLGAVLRGSAQQCLRASA
jgi:hypothetical protein